MIDKSRDEIRAGMNPIERRILERQEGEARWCAYLKRRKILRQTPIEIAMKQAYEDNEEVDRILARRKMLLERIREAETQGNPQGIDIDRLCLDKCFAGNGDCGLSAIPYTMIRPRRKNRMEKPEKMDLPGFGQDNCYLEIGRNRARLIGPITLETAVTLIGDARNEPATKELTPEETVKGLQGILESMGSEMANSVYAANLKGFLALIEGEREKVVADLVSYLQRYNFAEDVIRDRVEAVEYPNIGRIVVYRKMKPE